MTYADQDAEKICWRVNLKSIKNHYFDVIGYENEGEYKGDTVVIQGEKSHSWDLEVFKNNFPNMNQDDIKIVENAGIIIF